jgi:hypothetical protein
MLRTSHTFLLLHATMAPRSLTSSTRTVPRMVATLHTRTFRSSSQPALGVTGFAGLMSTSISAHTLKLAGPTRSATTILLPNVQQHVKEFWAAQLSDPARPTWVMRVLMKHFFPMPEYNGVMPITTPNGMRFQMKMRRRRRRCGERSRNMLMSWGYGRVMRRIWFG